MNLFIKILLIALLGNIHAQNWQVDPTNFELQMTITGILSINNEISQNDDYFIGAFVGDECRGYSESISVFNNEMYFLTIYSDLPNEIIEFKVFTDQEFLIQETEPFIPFESLGTPGDPYLWNVYMGYDFPPSLMDIPGQVIEQGYSFDLIDLSQYIIIQDEDLVSTFVIENENLNYEIEDNLLNIFPFSEDWVGTEEIQLVIQDVTESGLSDTTNLNFTILALNHEPIMYLIPNQTIGIGGQFESIDLNDYYFDENNDEVNLHYNVVSEYEEEEIPNWQINPTNFELSMSLTSIIFKNGKEVIGDQHQLGAFVNGELRGVTHALDALNRWIFFLTIYANENNEEIEFKFFDNDLNVVFPTSQSIDFLANEAIGNPQAPFEFTAGFLSIDILNNIANIQIVDYNWFGSEDVEFVVSEENTLQLYTDSEITTFTVMPDHHPQVMEIPNQIIEAGDNFNSINLFNYLIEEDGDEIEWTVSGNNFLNVEIQNQTVNINYTDWVGTETITFTATDQTINGFSSSAEVEFTVLNLDTQPFLIMPDSQTVGFSGDFEVINLNDYLIENDGDDIEWSYNHQTISEDENPNWTTNPSAFELSMTITATVESLGKPPNGSENTLAVFSNGELRGVTNAIFALNKWIYFLTVYSNQNNDDLVFKFYDSQNNRILPVNYQTQFVANNSMGSPQSPVELRAGQILVDIYDSNTMDFTIVDPLWSGVEIIDIIVNDVGTLNNFSAQTQITLTVLPDHAPLLSTIPNQEIETFHIFSSFFITDYLTELDGDSIIWTIDSDSTLIVFETLGYVTISPADFDWVGSTVVTYTATDNTTNGLSSSQQVTYTVYETDNAPNFINSPILETTLGTPFTPINLEGFVEELDGDSIRFDYDFPISDNPIINPEWNLNVGDFELSMTMTAKVSLASKVKVSGEHILGAFSGDELRGVATAVSFANNWVYFITIYSNSNDGEIHFKFFDNDKMVIYPTNSEIQFSANTSIGNPQNPNEIIAGYVSVNINDNIASFNTIPQYWTGTSYIEFIAQDVGSLNEYSDVIIVPLIIENDYPIINTQNQYDILEDTQIEPLILNQLISDFGTEFEDLIIVVSENQFINPELIEGVLQFNINENFNGNEIVSLAITDNHSINPKTTEFNIYFNILAVNDPPIFNYNNINLNEDFFGPIIIEINEMIHPNNESVQEIVFSIDDIQNNLINIEINPQNGTIIINPIEHQNGALDLLIIANDGQEVNNIYQFELSIIINPIDDPPEIISIPPDIATIDMLFNYQMNTNEYDGEELSYQLLNAPDEMNIDQFGLISWLPTEEFEDELIFIEVSVSDSNNSTIQSFYLEITSKVYIPMNFDDGNNLVSFPGVMENNNSINFIEALSQEDGEVNFIIGNSIGMFSVEDGWSGNLNTIQHDMGYWINFVTDDLQIVNREIEYLNLNQNCFVYEYISGNNLFSFKWGDYNAINTLDALGGIEYAIDHFNFIIGEGVGLFNLGEYWSGNLIYLENNSGYWINIKDDIDEFDFKWGMENCENPSNILEKIDPHQEIHDEFKINQSTSQAFYLINEFELEQYQQNTGDIILAYNGDVLIGSALCSIPMTTLTVMGKDLSDNTTGYIEEGQIPQLKLYSSSLDMIIDLPFNLQEFSNLLVSEVDIVPVKKGIIPTDFGLSDAYPNPFNPVTGMKLSLIDDGHTSVKVFNLMGQEIETIHDGFMNAGYHQINWNAVNVPSGIYLVKVVQGKNIASQKVMLMK